MFVIAGTISFSTVENITKNRWLFFILGLFLGAILSLFFYDNIMNDDENIAGETTSDTISIVEKNKEKTIEKENIKPAKKKKKIIKKEPEIIITDTAKTDTAGADSNTIKEKDILPDTISNSSQNTDIVVMQDELLYTKEIKPSGDVSVFLCDSGGELDSLLVDNHTSVHSDKIIVEFWKSPVNFKGYKLNSRKLVLFGVLEFDSLNLRYEKEKVLKMNYKNQEFDLHCNDDFIPLNIKN